MDEWPDIGAHRMLGDGRSAALITPTGEIDWWCAPRFDSPPVFWSLLDRRGGAARFDDVVPVDSAGQPAAHTTTTWLRTARNGHTIEVRDGLVSGRVLRLITATDGDLDVCHRVAVGGFGEAADPVWTVEELRGPPGCRVALAITADGVERLDPAETQESLERAAVAHERNTHVRGSHVHASRIRDAFAVVRLATYRPTGAVVAAVTTSLPEVPGADRQFDYRYAWLRDGSLAASVAALSDRLDIAAGNVRFLDHLGPRVFESPLFTVDGGPVPVEREVPDVTGWRSSQPIRVGNAAAAQVQYDALGFVVEAISTFTREGGHLRRPTWRLVQAIADRCCEDNDEPTSGIWELRIPQKLLCADIGRWIALDRAVRIARRRRPWTRSARRWRHAADRLRDRVLAELRADGRLPQVYGGNPDCLDASGLLVVMFEMLPADDPRARRLVDAHIRGLGEGAHLRRYVPAVDDGFDGREATFVPCSWWAVTALAAVGEIAAATERADALCAALPGLVAEEFDPSSGVALGNTPLVWAHAEMARALRVIDAAHIRQHWGLPGLAVNRVFRRGLRLREFVTRSSRPG